MLADSTSESNGRKPVLNEVYKFRIFQGAAMTSSMTPKNLKKGYSTMIVLNSYVNTI